MRATRVVGYALAGVFLVAGIVGAVLMGSLVIALLGLLTAAAAAWLAHGRECPHCGRVIARNATRCRHCGWREHFLGEVPGGGGPPGVGLWRDSDMGGRV